MFHWTWRFDPETLDIYSKTTNFQRLIFVNCSFSWFVNWGLPPIKTWYVWKSLKYRRIFVNFVNLHTKFTKISRLRKFLFLQYPKTARVSRSKPAPCSKKTAIADWDWEKNSVVAIELIESQRECLCWKEIPFSQTFSLAFYLESLSESCSWFKRRVQ